MKLWKRQEYHRLAEEGFMPDKHVELIGGVIYEVNPQSSENDYAIEKVSRILEDVFGDEYWARSQGPLIADDYSEPEPDLCVVRGSIELHPEHPKHGVLAVESSKTTLTFDTITKACLYASLRIPDYWVLDLENRQL